MSRIEVALERTKTLRPPSERAREMARLYREEGLTYREIGELHGITRQRVEQILRPFGIEPHWGARRKAEREKALRAAHARIQAGESTLAQESKEMGVAPNSLRSALSEIGLRVHTRTASPEHGTRYRYLRGCRCDDCRAAVRGYRALLTERGPSQHGTASAYCNYGCRCKECKEAWRSYSRELRSRKRRKQEVEE